MSCNIHLLNRGKSRTTVYNLANPLRLFGWRGFIVSHNVNEV